MSNPFNRDFNTPVDSLDVQQTEFNRSRHITSHQSKQQHIYKNFYKQQLDELLQQKNQYRSLEKQKQDQQRRIYNERLRLGQQAERIKELSYKNYYQMIMNNQENIKNKYVSPFQERDQEKEKLIDRGVEVGKVKSQLQYEREVRRQQNIKKQFQSNLNYQMNYKEEVLKKEHENNAKTNQYLKHVLLTPHEVQRIQRERKLQEQNKYKEDLDKLKFQKNNISLSRSHNPELQTSQSNIKLERHNILLNPLPFNIQNPYILKEMQKKNNIYSNPSFPTNTEQYQYSQTKRNIFG